MKIYRLISALFVIFLLSACALLRPVKLPRQGTYTISGPYIAIPTDSKTSRTILVSTPVASSGYQSSKMIYIQTPFKLRAYAKNRWIAAPAEMLLPLFAQRLRACGYFKAVVTPPFSGITNYRLDTQLLTLQQEFLRPTSLIRLVIQATLINTTTNRVLASRRFQVMVSAPGNNPYSGVLAANKAADIMSKRLSSFVIQSVR